MKAGLVFFIFAMRALRDLNVEVKRNVVLQINSDEEVGSLTSRPLTEEAARKERSGPGARTGHGARGQAQDLP